jgi:hypothetical protein
LQVPKLTPEQIQTIESVFNQIKEHTQYHQSIVDAVNSELDVSLNYHNHPGEPGYCVSILSEKIDLLTLTEDRKSLVELAHIKNIGTKEDDCVPLMSYFGKSLKEKYKLKQLPDVYLNGQLYLKDE